MRCNGWPSFQWLSALAQPISWHCLRVTCALTGLNQQLLLRQPERAATVRDKTNPGVQHTTRNRGAPIVGRRSIFPYNTWNPRCRTKFSRFTNVEQACDAPLRIVEQLQMPSALALQLRSLADALTRTPSSFQLRITDGRAPFPVRPSTERVNRTELALMDIQGPGGQADVDSPHTSTSSGAFRSGIGGDFPWFLVLLAKCQAVPGRVCIGQKGVLSGLQGGPAFLLQSRVISMSRHPMERIKARC